MRTRRDSNPQPCEPESDALSIELRMHNSLGCKNSEYFPISGCLSAIRRR